LQGFPEAHCRVLAVDRDDHAAYFILDTGPVGYRYLYSGTVERHDDGWHPGIDSNGGGIGWTRIGTHGELGVVAIRGEAPAGAGAVRAEWRGQLKEALVQNGVVLLTWWREPYPEDWPAIVAFRVADRWLPPPRDWHL
jgi:hypothetical protein